MKSKSYKWQLSLGGSLWEFNGSNRCLERFELSDRKLCEEVEIAAERIEGAKPQIGSWRAAALFFLGVINFWPQIHSAAKVDGQCKSD